MDMKQIIAGRIADAAQASFENCALTVADVTAMLETPPDKKLGDYALPCFRLSKTLRKAPQMIASALDPSFTEAVICAMFSPSAALIT